MSSVGRIFNVLAALLVSAAVLALFAFGLWRLLASSYILDRAGEGGDAPLPVLAT